MKEKLSVVWEIIVEFVYEFYIILIGVVFLLISGFFKLMEVNAKVLDVEMYWGKWFETTPFMIMGFVACVVAYVVAKSPMLSR